jgi:hypothetical protein
MNKYLEKIAEMHEVKFHSDAHPMGFLAESSKLQLNPHEYAGYVKDKDKAWTGGSMAKHTLGNAAGLGAIYGVTGHAIGGSKGALIGAILGSTLGAGLGLRHSENIASSKALEKYFPEIHSADGD